MYELTLNDFEYEINGDNLIFKKPLNLIENEIKILDKYIINNNEYILNEIDNCAFLNSTITDIQLPDTIEIIGEMAFMDSLIKSINIPKKVKILPFGCFGYCKNLYNIKLNRNIKICNGAFSDCKLLNIYHQNNKDIYIDDYLKLKNKKYSDAQINQILKGYEKLIFLNDLPVDTPVDVFRTIIFKFDKIYNCHPNIINSLKNNKLNKYEIIDIYNKLNIL